VDPVIAVTSVPDEKKGEKLVVLHAVDLDVVATREDLAARGLTNLWIPKREHFYKVEAIPLLGTGKVDLKGIKTLALNVSQDSAVKDNEGDNHE
jgi:acyl-[acyl-carrier-protein]-phospholipid O-acyltransferase / long-chain-fatty-acid--[acyl-carrier-protein] ligase